LFAITPQGLGVQNLTYRDGGLDPEDASSVEALRGAIAGQAMCIRVEQGSDDQIFIHALGTASNN
jgi:hypothetical protein